MAGPFVDRLEGSFAVLIVGGREKRVPLASLPPGVREGVYLTFDLAAVDEAATRRAKGEMSALRERMKKDDGGDFSL